MIFSLLKHRFHPKLFSTLGTYSRATLLQDLAAGVTVGIVAVPLALAFAIASGVRPEQGLYTAVVAGFFISLLGGSRTQVSGPTGAFIVVIYGIVQQHGYNGLAVATIMAGAMLIIMGLCGFGSIINLIPRPLVLGFTAGIGVIIFSSQLRDLLGLDIAKLPSSCWEQWRAYAQAFGTLDSSAVTLGLSGILFISFYPRLVRFRFLPAPLALILFATLLVEVLHLPVATVASRFGSVPSHFPLPAFPEFSLSDMRGLFQPALAIALLGAIESLLSAVVADSMTGHSHRSNTELVAQGVGNILSPLFSGIPATGAIARTATNVRAGAKTPIAGIAHALTVLSVLLIFGSYASLIPLPALAAILIIVAWNMSEAHAFIRQLYQPGSDRLVLLVTFTLTVLVDLVAAIEVGILVACILFILKIARHATVKSIPTSLPRVGIFEVHGPLFFATATRFKNCLLHLDDNKKLLVIDFEHVPMMDATGLYQVEVLIARCKEKSIKLLFSGLNTAVNSTLSQLPASEILRARSVSEALAQSKQLGLL